MVETPHKKPYKLPARVKRSMRDKLSEEQGGCCYWCGVHMEHYLSSSLVRITLEHKVPRSLGGTNRKSNLAAACYACNYLRGVMNSMTHLQANALAERIMLLHARGVGL